MKKIVVVFLLLVLALFIVLAYNTLTFKSKQIVCAHPLAPKSFRVDSAAIGHLAGAIQIRTVSYDDSVKMQGSTAFDTMLAFLRSSYPAVFSALQDTVINGRNLLLKWGGSATEGLPFIFYAHMDVVPIEEASISQWKHAPFSGDTAAGFIWGRGAIDDKGSLISIFEALNRLVQSGFKPRRTFYFAMGSDEEIGGKHGAETIATYFRNKHQKFQFYLDEGLMVSEGMVPGINRDVALIGTAEKGYATCNLSVNMKGGHSSSPAPETAIDVLNQALLRIHSHPFSTRITQPVNEFFEYTGPEMYLFNKVIFANTWLFRPLILSQLQKSKESNAMLRTTGVTTVFNAGIKENVIPSIATAKVNFRILPGETSAQVERRVKEIINDPRVSVTAGGVITEPSKCTPANSPGFKLLQRTCSEVFPDAYISPFLMIASTDSKHFEDLCDEIYRFFPTRMDKEALSGFHGVNEKIKISCYMETICFYEQLIKDMQEEGK